MVGPPERVLGPDLWTLRTHGDVLMVMTRVAFVCRVLQEFVMGMSMLVFLVALKILSKRVKKLHWAGAMGPILACVIGISAVAAGNLNKRGIKIVEKIPQGALSDMVVLTAQLSNQACCLCSGSRSTQTGV